MTLIDQADRLLMDHKQPIITEAMQSELSRQLNADFDKLSATALRIKAERDALWQALNRLTVLIELAASSAAPIKATHPAVLDARAELAKVML